MHVSATRQEALDSIRHDVLNLLSPSGDPHLPQGTRYLEGPTASGKFSNQAGMNFLNELSWQKVVISPAGLAFLPIPEEMKSHQHLIREGTQHQQGTMASGTTLIVQSARSWYGHTVTNVEEQDELLRLDV